MTVGAEGQRMLARRLVEDGGVCFASAATPTPFYLRVERLEGAVEREEDVLLEVTFNPEFVVLSGIRTDLVVEWGPPAELEDWLLRLLDGLGAAPCPPHLEMKANQMLFGPGSANRDSIDRDDPWGFARTGI